jgi:hypothetical protein
VDNLTAELDRSYARSMPSRFWRAHCPAHGLRGVCSIADAPFSRFQGPACWTGLPWLVPVNHIQQAPLAHDFSGLKTVASRNFFPVHFWTFTGITSGARGLGGRAGARSHCMTPVLAGAVFTHKQMRGSSMVEQAPVKGKAAGSSPTLAAISRGSFKTARYAGSIPAPRYFQEAAC